jgi:hypothetical protein
MHILAVLTRQYSQTYIQMIPPEYRKYQYIY